MRNPIQKKRRRSWAAQRAKEQPLIPPLSALEVLAGRTFGEVREEAICPKAPDTAPPAAPEPEDAR